MSLSEQIVVYLEPDKRSGPSSPLPGGMLLGFIVSERDIEANPEKILAITRMGPIQNMKGVQRVTWCLTALSLFISCLGE